MKTTLLSVLSIGTVAHLMYRRKQFKTASKKDLIGNPLLLPPNQDVVWTPCFSPSGKKIVLVCGDLTRKSVFLADYPVKDQDDYRLIKSFDNCYKIDGISVYEGREETRIAFRETHFQSDTVLSGIQTPEQWKNACRDHGVKDNSFTSSILVVDSDGNQTVIGETLASLKESLTASTTWQDEKTLWFLDKESQTLSRFDLDSGDKKVMSSDELHPLTRIQQISYNTKLNELTALDIDRQIAKIDPEDFHVELKSQEPFIQNNDEGGILYLDTNGESVVLQTDRMIVRHRIDDRSNSSFKIKGHYFANFRIASVNSSSSSGIAILVYPKIDQFEKSNAFTTELRTLKIP